jgi:hypothetical protein
MRDYSGQAHSFGTRFEIEVTKELMGGESDVDGEISAAQRSCPPVGGIPLHHLPLVLGREVKRGEIADRQFAHLGDLGGRNGRRSLVTTISYW